MNFDDDPFAFFISEHDASSIDDLITDDVDTDVGDCMQLCMHTSTIENKGSLMCTECGEEIEKNSSI